MRTWPTKTQVTIQLVIAVGLTLVAVLDGIVMISVFKPLMVLVEIVLASCAVITWCQYLDTKSLIDLKDILSSQQKLNESNV